MRINPKPRIPMPAPTEPADSAERDVQLFNDFWKALHSDKAVFNDRDVRTLWKLAIALRKVPGDDKAGRSEARKTFFTRAKALGVDAGKTDNRNSIKAVELVAGKDPNRDTMHFSIYGRGYGV